MPRAEVLFIGGRAGVGKTRVPAELHANSLPTEFDIALIEGDNLDLAWPTPVCYSGSRERDKDRFERIARGVIEHQPRSVNQAMSAEWLEASHFTQGDLVVTLTRDLEDPIGQSLLIRNEPSFDAQASMWQFDGRLFPAASVRHADQRHCPPCGASIAEIHHRAFVTEWAQRSRSSWSVAAERLFTQLTIDWHHDEDSTAMGSFSMDSAAPSWLRRLTSSLLSAPVSPGLTLARVTAPIDWPALARDHPADLAVSLAGPQDDRLIASYESLYARMRADSSQHHLGSFDVELAVRDGAGDPMITAEIAGLQFV